MTRLCVISDFHWVLLGYVCSQLSVPKFEPNMPETVDIQIRISTVSPTISDPIKIFLVSYQVQYQIIPNSFEILLVATNSFRVHSKTFLILFPIIPIRSLETSSHVSTQTQIIPNSFEILLVATNSFLVHSSFQNLFSFVPNNYPSQIHNRYNSTYHPKFYHCQARFILPSITVKTNARTNVPYWQMKRYVQTVIIWNLIF